MNTANESKQSKGSDKSKSKSNDKDKGKSETPTFERDKDIPRVYVLTKDHTSGKKAGDEVKLRCSTCVWWEREYLGTPGCKDPKTFGSPEHFACEEYTNKHDYDAVVDSVLAIEEGKIKIVAPIAKAAHTLQTALYENRLQNKMEVVLPIFQELLNNYTTSEELAIVKKVSKDKLAALAEKPGQLIRPGSWVRWSEKIGEGDARKSVEVNGLVFKVTKKTVTIITDPNSHFKGAPFEMETKRAADLLEKKKLTVTVAAPEPEEEEEEAEDETETAENETTAVAKA